MSFCVFIGITMNVTIVMVIVCILGFISIHTVFDNKLVIFGIWCVMITIMFVYYGIDLAFVVFNGLLIKCT